MQGDATQLDRGFVYVGNQRIFVPRIGAPRVTPSLEAEAHLLKAKDRADRVTGAIAFAIILGCAVAGYQELGILMAIVAISVGYMTDVRIERRSIATWPALDTAEFARTRFLVWYLRGGSCIARLSNFAISCVGIAICAFVSTYIGLPLAQSGSAPTAILVLAGVIVGPGALTLPAARFAIIALIALLPGERQLRRRA
jgi:hypothetical protein